MNIKRTQVINVIRDINEKGGFKNFSAYSECYNRILNLEEQKEKTAHWVKLANGITWCSECQTKISEYQLEIGINNYCPCCGARMLRRRE